MRRINRVCTNTVTLWTTPLGPAIEPARAGFSSVDRKSYEKGSRSLRESDQLDVISTNHLDDEFDASPVVVGNELFLRGEKFVYCLSDKGTLGQQSPSVESSGRKGKPKS